VRDSSSKLGKQVELTLTGQHTELDRTVVEALGDPLVHLVRNSLDHGLEPPEERELAGKPATGTLELAARHVGSNVVITVRDDGRGIDPARIARRAAERGLIEREAIAGVDAQQAIELLFQPGFSTAEVTSDLSGRGVGMDVVRATVRRLGGEVAMSSEPGHGTTAQIRLPLTLAIMNALLVEAAGLPFAVPLDRVERTLGLAEHTIRSVAGQKMVVLREGALPLLDAAAALGHESCRESTYGVVVRAAEQRVVLAVDRLVGQRELVTRPLPSALGEHAAVSGGAVLSNGDIALIVDCDAIARRERLRMPRLAAAA
jgi:two-component system chemotaxis sensor kinase CheA